MSDFPPLLQWKADDVMAGRLLGEMVAMPGRVLWFVTPESGAYRVTGAFMSDEEDRHSLCDCVESAKTTAEGLSQYWLLKLEPVLDALTMALWSRGTDHIKRERDRQLREKRYFRTHDQQYTGKQLARNARSVLQSYINGPGGYSPAPSLDQWGLGSKHNADPLKCLKIAGALIAAEIDRIELVRKEGELKEEFAL